MRPVFEIGKVLMTILLRCKFSGDTRNNIIDSSLLIYKMGVDEFEARSITRKMDEIGDKLSASCKTVLDNYQISDERRDYIIDLLLETYKDTNITINDFFEDYSTEELLYRRLIATNPSYKDGLDQIESELYERLLSHSSALLFQAFYEIPEFQSVGIKHLNSKMDEVKKNIDFIIRELENANFGGQNNEKGLDYENQYMRNIISKLNHVYLFGVNNMERALKRYKLSIAYVSLELLHNDEVYDINKLLEKKQNIWIVGEAGAGKTTLIQWIAVQFARRYSEKSIVPIYVELRNMHHGFSLKNCINNIMKDSTYEMPQGWIEQKIQSGKAVILFDGFDEISIEQREAVFNRIEEIDPENKCKKVYTARPQITQRPCDKGLLDVVIKPMNKKTVKKFLEYWHKAVLEDQLQLSHEETERTVSRIYSKIELNPSIFRLASSPLLCAMICALHYKNEMNLPINKRQLYDECCRLLIENRDLEKGVESSVKLTYEQKEVILSQLALWMMINRYNDIDKLTATQKVQGFASSMVFTNQNHVTDSVFPYLLERCGILREPEKNRIDFVHRSFEEYLAAIEIRRQSDWGFLQSVAVDDMWKETVEIAIGFANIEIASSIIKSVFSKSKGRKGDKKNLFLAFSYYNNALQVDYKTTAQIKQNLQEMIPPSKYVVADLINIGEVVVDFLKFERGGTHKPEEFVNSLKVLRGIGSTKALEMANSYLTFDLPVEAIKEYGIMLEDFSIKELIEYDTPKIIEQFVYTFYSHHMTLHEGMLRVLLLADDSVVGRIEKIINRNLTIIGYTDNLDLSRLFRRGLVNNLKLYGDFVSARQIDLFPRLKNIVICTVNNSFEGVETSHCCHELYSIDLIMNLKDQAKINFVVFNGCNNMTLIDINTEHEHGTNIHLNTSYVSDVRIGGGFLNRNVVIEHEQCNGKLKLLLNKKLYNDFEYIDEYHNVGFGNIDDIIEFHKIKSGGMIKYKAFGQNKEDVYECVSSYLGLSAATVRKELERIELHNWYKSHHTEKKKMNR